MFNDILGIRIIVDNYSLIDQLVFPPCTRIADMRSGKTNDDGYRGIHVYYQKDHFHYPIEIQFMTTHDRQFNEWLHLYVYKIDDDLQVGRTLRAKYDAGAIQNEDDFGKEYRDYVLSHSKELQRTGMRGY